MLVNHYDRRIERGKKEKEMDNIEMGSVRENESEKR
jgi:hypothetical protein